MDTTAPEPRVLVIGLDPYRVPGPWDPAPVADAIAVGMARFADAASAFNSTSGDTFDAAARWLDRPG